MVVIIGQLLWNTSKYTSKYYCLDENSSSETLYIGTDLGVFIRDNTSTDWSNFNNLTLLQCHSFRIRNSISIK